MRLSRIVSLGLLLLTSLLILPTATTAQGNSEAAKACQQGGYLYYLDAQGNGFENTAQCVRYAAQGNTLVPRVVDLSIDGGAISGTGFTQNSTVVVLHRHYTPSGAMASNIPGDATIDATGAFSFPGHEPCVLWPAATELTITATDAAGVSHTETFDLDSFCA